MKNLKQYLPIISLFLSLLFSPFTLYANQAVKPKEPVKQTHLVAQVNINQSTAEELAKYINGIGLNKAKKIVEYREKFGPFVSLEQLKEVSGIGQSILDKNVGKLVL